ncbi:ABC transporter ATP-binding protein [Halosimplex litoreum]|uniref:ABC-type D-xylose/L-arabinose transporter n=1 Tax=Halosimplex litoreum TaxID=1198301 RepID=A0A7T3FVQ4_9EURY|nr:ABC transporter ATP-binding protein [Halosimplex litoreum]QPV61624.1 ABC transporter ATP-binding protein [Halosimplex litoreum]
MGSLRMEHVTKRYDDVVAVDDMNLDIEDSEFICLVGPSGCGKSTTLEMIGGLTTPSEGDVYIGDRDVTDLPPKDRGLAMVFQNIALFPHMDVYDNISYGLRLRDFPQDEIDERVDEAAEILQLEGMIDRMPSELSGGQRQRVAIGRAIVRDPDVFLMDEPLANLDAKLRVHMRTELQRLQRQLDVTTIYVTHDQEEAMTMSDRIAVINHGVLQQIAPPLTCYNEPANLFVAGFIGSPSMNFFEGRLDGDRLRFDSFDIDVSDVDLPGDLTDVTLGIRQEDVYPAEQADSIEAPSSAISATVDVLEPVGEQIFVYLDTGTEMADVGVETEEDEIGADIGSLLMGVDPDYRLEEGDEIEVVFDRSKLHLFETSSGDALVHGMTAKQLVDETQ